MVKLIGLANIRLWSVNVGRVLELIDFGVELFQAEAITVLIVLIRTVI